MTTMRSASRFPMQRLANLIYNVNKRILKVFMHGRLAAIHRRLRHVYVLPAGAN